MDLLINKVEYLDSQGELKEVNNISSPCSINLRVRAAFFGIRNRITIN